MRENAEGPARLAEACAARGLALLTFSSDLVFDGRSGRPYVESDAVSPLNVYGVSKAEAERRVLDAKPDALVVRTSAFFGPWDEFNFVTLALGALARGDRVVAADDAVVSPAYVPDLATASLDLLIDGACGIWHLANEGETTWADLARAAARAAGLDASLVDARSTSSLGLAAPRPRFSALGSVRTAMMPPLENAICRYLAARPLEVARPARAGRDEPTGGSELHVERPDFVGPVAGDAGDDPLARHAQVSGAA
jgi:dTDP-4-dehydrorhamnose reductase